VTARSAERGLGRYVRHTIYPYSAHYRTVLDATGVGRRVRSPADLLPVPPTDLTELDDPGALVLRPDVPRMLRHGGPLMAGWTATARVTGGMRRLSRHVERRFKPVQWVLAEGVPLGYSADDLDRLGARGAAWLRRAGVGGTDVVVSLLPAGPTVAHWQLMLGCQRAGVSAIHLGPAADPVLVERLVPSVLVGDPAHLHDVLAAVGHEGRQLAWLRTVLAVGDPLGAERRARLRERAGGVPVVAAWAPPGVRAIWTECRAGADGLAPTGYHTWREDLLEVAAGGSQAAPGELLWTGVGWSGSALLRLRTFAIAATFAGACPACGEPGPLVLPHAPVARPAAAAPDSPAPEAEAPWPAPVVGVAPVVTAEGAVATLDPPVTAVSGVAPVVTRLEEVFAADPDVAEWHVERRSVDGRDELIVTLAPVWGAAVVPLIRRLDRHLHATQFVVLSADEVAARVEASDGERVVVTTGD
jgi:predicted small lipoprotein YifL